MTSTGAAPSLPHLALVTLLVRDYDEAIAWYRDRLGFTLLEDRPLEGGKRWVVVAPGQDEPGPNAPGLLLARASGERQAARVGDQFGGRVGFFLHTDDFARDHARFEAAGVAFTEAPRHEPYGTVVVFTDLYGNRWDLVQPKP